MSMRILCCFFQLAFALHTAGFLKSSVFRPTGGSVTLEFQQHQQPEKEQIDIVFWEYGPNTTLKYVPHKDTVTVFTHKGRVEFNKETFSMELKNLQKSDSGLYRGKISAGTEVIVEHTLSVLDPVEIPVLSVVSNWSSSDSCNVTVTCRGRDHSLNSTCDIRTCSIKEENSIDSTLSLSVRDALISCNYSNTVSWRTDKTQIELLCPFYEEQTVAHSENSNMVIGIVVPGALICVLSMAVWRWRKSKKYSSQTTYATVERQQKTPSGGEAAHQGSPLTSKPLPNTLYSTVVHPLKPVSAGENQECVVNPIYRQVEHLATHSLSGLHQ
ncbi:CD48 antigen-like [Alosa sapidissima]|uniref:CD48 antigen-like n=1 Tax=Alosa sapidissima TaxID=34773 RepID=UPI001C085E2B|nr:CD48 antigen-like [Alosa sapidissima]